MLAQRSVPSMMSGMHGAQTVRGQGDGLVRKALKLLQRKNHSRCYSAFFLCISMHWLFWELPRSWSAGERPKRFIGTFRTEAMSTERTAVAVRMAGLPDADGFPTPSSWGLVAPLRFITDE